MAHVVDMFLTLQPLENTTNLYVAICVCFYLCVWIHGVVYQGLIGDSRGKTEKNNCKRKEEREEW